MISFIVPVYNGGKYLPGCVESIIKNCAYDYEILIVNDGSTDNSGEIAKEICLHSHNIRYFEKENSGVSDTRNYGIEMARGKWICFVDVDDFFMGEIDKSLLEKDEETDIIVFSKNFSNKKELKQSEETVMFLTKCILKEAEVKEYNSCFFNAVWSKLYRTEMIKNNHICFDKNLVNGEDSFFNIQCVKFARKIICIPRTIYKWRVVAGSATRRYQPKIELTDEIFLSALKDVIKDFSPREKWERIYNTIAINGLWIVVFLKVAHFRNEKSLCEKYNEFQRIKEKPVYSKGLSALNTSSVQIPLKRKIVLNMMNSSFWPIAIKIIEYQTKNKNDFQEYMLEI